MTVVAKMRLSSLTEVRNNDFVGRNGTEYEYEANPGAKIEMHGVQSEPFGKATPWAKFEANIFGSTAAQWFSDLWRKYVRDPDSRAAPPELYVLFMTPVEYEQYMNGGRDLARSEREA